MVGRGRKNNIIIRDYEVSREHCLFVRVLDQYELHDLGSSNGTFVNGHPVDERGWLLDSKSLIELGESITLEYEPDEVTGEQDPVAAPTTTAISRHSHYLVVQVEEQEGPAVYPLDRPTITIGRGLDNDIVIQAPEMSRRHMRLTLVPSGYVLEDLESLNGTHVRGSKIEGPYLLRADDVVTVGTTVQLHYTTKPEDVTGNVETEVFPISSPLATDDPTRDRRMLGTKLLDNLGNRQTETVPKSDMMGHGLDPGELEGKVLIAYAQEDWTPIVMKIFSFLEDKGVGAWADQYLAYGSDDWKQAIEQALAECGMLVAVVSPEAMSKDYVKRSIRHFLNREKPVILFHYKDVDRLPMSAQRLPAIWYNAAIPEDSFRRLTVEIQRKLQSE